jgi:adenylyltransferase/sulfurtransferase
MTIFADGRAIIKGTDDLALARSLYARYLGS